VATLVNGLGVSPTQTVWSLPIVFGPFTSLTRTTISAILEQPVPPDPAKASIEIVLLSEKAEAGMVLVAVL